YALRVAGGTPGLLSSEALRMDSALVDLAVDDSHFGGETWAVQNSIHLRRSLLLDDRLTERLTLTNHMIAPIDYWVELSVGADFADIFEVRGWRRPQRGTFYAPQLTERSIQFVYRGRDGQLVHSEVAFSLPPSEVHARGARWNFRLEPHRPMILEWQVLPDPILTGAHRPAPGSLDQRRTRMRARYDRWASECTRWNTDVEEFNSALAQATLDLRALFVDYDGQHIMSAGIPWYSAAFGRDSIITSLQTLAVNPKITRDTLTFLARHQGTHEDSFTEEQPGRIMHELRRGEMARAGEIPHVPYYGTIDATPLFLILLHEAWRWTGDEAFVRGLLPNAARALEWIDRYGDLDGDGLVEYASTSAKGLTNQGWKDSRDGVPFPDGTLPVAPIALVEVQGYVYDAKVRMASLYDAFGEPQRAEQLRRQAAELREEIVRRFWLDHLGTFALALDGHKTPVPTITSNAGHLLWSRVPDAAQAERMAGVLLRPDMFSGWGIRTLSAAEPVYNPMSYHDGSVWPHDNAIIALGLSLYGHTRAALPVLSALHDAAVGMRYHRLPELYCGFQRANGIRPVLYPVSCSPQGWAAGALFMLLQAVTGLLPDAPARRLHIREPLLPPFIHELLIEGLAIGGSRVALQFTRRGTRTLANLLDVEGDPLHVTIELA
ncbi:MAG TPA: glycogen debranching N-terminal domain-containing protein, partial [Gemmatimonadaceae bacterium]|nr:glycogen debranching N-terminal domain-containing protein [Gemmatimonadaceae bacterium]